jgi:hypothetical protein
MANEQQTIANLIVRLSAQTVELAAGLKRGEGMVSSFKSTIQSILGGITFAAIGYKLSKAITDATVHVANLSKTAEKVGVPVRSLSLLAEAADDLGISVDQLAVGLKFLSRSMFEASQGSGDARQIFKALKVEYESMPGVLRPLEETMLDMADVFSRMEDGPAKTAMALKVFGRSGIEMIPLLNKGREALREWMKDAERTGLAVDDALGKKARAFGKTMNNIGDAIRGMSLALMAELLPAMQSAAKWMLDMAKSANDLRENAHLVTEALRYMGAVVIPLFIVKLASMISLVGIANLALRAFGATLAFFSGPLGWITVGIVALSVAWTALGKGARDAAREHERFVDSVRSMKIDDLKETLRDTELQLTLLTQKYKAMIEELERSGDFNVFSVGTSAEADATKKKIDELKDRIKILQGAIGDINKTKIAPPVLTPEEALKKLEGKLREVRAQIIGLGDATGGAKAALEAFIAETIRGVPMTGQLAAAVRQLRLEFGLYTALQQVRANLVAREKGDLALSTAANEAAAAALRRNYEQGLVDVSSYYQQRRDLIRKSIDEEIAALEKESERPGTPEARKIEITAEIKVKRTKEAQELAEDIKAEADAYKELMSVISQGGLEQLVANNDLSMAHLQASYDDGLIDMRSFFAERRRIIEENAQAAITTIETQIPGMDPKAAEDAKNKIAAIRSQLFSENQKVNRDEILQVRANELEKFNIVAGFAQLKADAATGDLDRLQAQQEVDRANLASQHAQQLQQIQEFKDELILVDGEYLTKKEALEKAQFDQVMARTQLQAEQERAVLQLRLQMASQVATGMQDLFGTLYEASGKKIKAFFYLEKAAAIANAIINTAQGVTKALAQGGIFGITMAGIITATGAAQIALIMAQTIQGVGMKKGGPVRSGSGAKDDVPAMLTRGEYVQPEPTVRYYGVEIMEAIRRRLIPKDIFKGFGFFPPARPQFAFATGGAVTGGGDAIDNRSTSVGPFHFHLDAPISDRAIDKMKSGFRRVVVEVMKEESRD